MPFLADAKMIGIIRHSYFTGEERKIHEEGGKKQDDRHNLLNRCLSKKKKKRKKVLTQLQRLVEKRNRVLPMLE